MKKNALRIGMATLLLSTPSFFTFAWSDFTEDPMQVCIYKHNGVNYAGRTIYSGICPDIDPPDGIDGQKHKITGFMPRSDPRWVNLSNTTLKIDTHDCEVRIIKSSFE